MEHVDPTVFRLFTSAPFPWRGKGRGWGGGNPPMGRFDTPILDRVSAAHRTHLASTPAQLFPLEGKGSGV